MPRLDIAWDSGVSVREAAWSWRHDIAFQVVNPDIDGLLTACLLHHLKGWPIFGFYDTQRLVVDARHALPLDLARTVWVDIDMCWPGARSLSQHVVMDAPTDADRVSAYAETVNPSLLRRHSRQVNYTTKYPFGTFQWAWWLAGRKHLPAAPDPSDPLMTGLAWMPDGGFLSIRERWRRNCIRWATTTLPGSILAPLAQAAPDHAAQMVAEAAQELRRRSGVDRGWRNHQFNLTVGSATGPCLVMTLDEGLASMQALCDVICDIYGWCRLVLPSHVELLRGGYHTTSGPPPGWPDAANRHELVSLAVTRGTQFCWTTPEELTAALRRSP